MKQVQKFKGKKAIITGASTGIGKAVALSLAQEGCNIFMVARREEKLKELKKEIVSLGVQAEYAVGDVTDEKFVKTAVEQAHNAWGSLDVFVLAAGDAFIKPFQMTSLAEFRSLMEVNSFGIVNFCKEGVKKISPGGSIILISSFVGVHGAKGMSAYALSKGGIVAFGKSLAMELSIKKIRVNMISPGFVETDMTKKVYRRLDKAQIKRIKGAHPLGAGSPLDIANAITFLASDESSWITGNVLAVDGGFTLGG